MTAGGPENVPISVLDVTKNLNNIQNFGRYCKHFSFEFFLSDYYSL